MGRHGVDSFLKESKLVLNQFYAESLAPPPPPRRRRNSMPFTIDCLAHSSDTASYLYLDYIRINMSCFALLKWYHPFLYLVDSENSGAKNERQSRNDWQDEWHGVRARATIIKMYFDARRFDCSLEVLSAMQIRWLFVFLCLLLTIFLILIRIMMRTAHTLTQLCVFSYSLRCVVDNGILAFIHSAHSILSHNRFVCASEHSNASTKWKEMARTAWLSSTK